MMRKNKINKLILFVLIVSIMVFSLILVGLTADLEPIKLRVNTNVKGHANQVAFDMWLEYTNEKLSNYIIEPQIFILGEIASAGEGIDAIKADMIDMFTEALSWQTNWDPRMGIVEQAFLWKDPEQLNRILHEEGLADKLNESLLEKTGNVRILATYYTGSRWMYFKNKIDSIEDLPKVQMRIPGSRPYRDMAELLGVQAIAVNWADIYTALESGLVEALEGPPPDVYAEGYHQPCNYFWPSNHLQMAEAFYINNDLFNSFPSEVRSAMLEAAEEIEKEMYKIRVSEMEKYSNILQEAGLELIMQDVDMSPLKEKANEIHMRWAKESDAIDLLEYVESKK